MSKRAQRLADYAGQRDPQQLLDEGRGFASRRPGAFLAGAALLGAMTGRLVKGSKADSGPSGASGSGPGTGTGSSAQPSYGNQPMPSAPLPPPARPGPQVPVSPATDPSSHGALTTPAPLGAADAPEEPVVIVDDAPPSGRTRPATVSPVTGRRSAGGPSGG